jgi:hypothetical protein
MMNEAFKDTVDEPGERPDNNTGQCLNCSEHWGHHHGWACSWTFKKYKETRRNNLASWERYRTPDMKEDLSEAGKEALRLALAGISYFGRLDVTKSASVTEKETDIGDWRVWRASSIAKHECPCGIDRRNCSYHN